MKVSTKGRYGLRAMIDLASNTVNGIPVFLSEIARRQTFRDVPKKTNNSQSHRFSCLVHQIVYPDMEHFRFRKVIHRPFPDLVFVVDRILHPRYPITRRSLRGNVF